MPKVEGIASVNIDRYVHSTMITIYLTIIPQACVGYGMVDSQRGK